MSKKDWNFLNLSKGNIFLVPRPSEKSNFNFKNLMQLFKKSKKNSRFFFLKIAGMELIIPIIHAEDVKCIRLVIQHEIDEKYAEIWNIK